MTQEIHSGSRHHQNSRPPFYASDECKDGMTALWVAVLMQAMMDATSRSRNAETQKAKQEAIGWLSGNSADFIDVCLFAGYEPDFIRKEAKRIIANPKRWRAEPGQGARYEERKRYRKLHEKKNREERLQRIRQERGAAPVSVVFAWQQQEAGV